MAPFGPIQIGRYDSVVVLQPWNPARVGNVEQDAAADDAAAQQIDRAPPRAVGRHLIGIETVLHLTMPENMAERIQMRLPL